uniref:Uncharacterized protein n=1 Tax=Oryza meridionalis TaxID=40149 RepID=A0A0E0CH05_9ORYZ
MAASTRVWVLAAVLVACAIAVRSARAGHASGHAAGGEEEDAGAAAPAPSKGHGCNPLKDKTCRHDDRHEPENQEEEGGFGVRLPSFPSLTGDDGDDDELPSFDTHMTILGH